MNDSSNNSSTDSLTERQLEALVHRLIHTRAVKVNGGKAAINYFVGRRMGKSTSELIRQAKFNKQCDELKTNATQPWDRRPDETTKAYEAFVIYRDMGADRTFVETARQLSKGPTTIDLWKRQYQWAARVRAYDEWDEKRLRRVAGRAKKEMVERQARLGMSMTDKAQSALDSGFIQPETVADVVRLAEAGTRIERLARGESTENVATGMSLVLAHPLPPWAPEAAKLLVTENEYEDQDGEGNVITPAGTKTEA